MCCRYTLFTEPDYLKRLFGLDEAPWLEPRYNVAPMQPILVIRSLQRVCTHVQWGLVPVWAKPEALSRRLFNARAETIADKPAFRGGIRYRRCLAPADGYYEWRQEGDIRQPYYIQMPDGAPFALAAIWESWLAPDGSELQSGAIITTEASDDVRDVHDRMPAILTPDQYDAWLDGSMEDPARVTPLLRPLPAGSLVVRPVNRRVNSVRNDGPELLLPPDAA